MPWQPLGLGQECCGDVAEVLGTADADTLECCLPVKDSLDAIEGGDAIKLSWEASVRL